MAKPAGTYTTSDLSRKSGDIIAEALRRPVTITQRNKPRLVLLAIEDYEKLRHRADTRSVGTIETMPDSLLLEVEDAIEAYADDDESGQL
jgi:prevent-host-death family protein